MPILSYLRYLEGTISSNLGLRGWPSPFDSPKCHRPPLTPVCSAHQYSTPTWFKSHTLSQREVHITHATQKSPSYPMQPNYSIPTNHTLKQTTGRAGCSPIPWSPNIADCLLRPPYARLRKACRGSKIGVCRCRAHRTLHPRPSASAALPHRPRYNAQLRGVPV